MHAVSDGQDHAKQKQGFMQFGNDYGRIWDNYLKHKFILSALLSL